MTEIYFIDVSPFRAPRNYRQALLCLSVERRKKLEHLKLQDDRIRCVAAGYLLHRVLAKRGIDAAKASYRYGEFGKPYLADNSYFFSLSHAGDVAMCAISDCSEVGCDVECHANLKITSRFFTADELETLQSSDRPEETFLRIWTLKESFIKRSGKGLSTPLTSFGIKLSDASKCDEFPNLNFSEFRLSSLCHGAVCTEDEINHIPHFISFE